MKINKCDFLIIGGGIFGVYAALFLSRQFKVVLIEKADQLCTKASIINQARVHSGYHYPRSVSTAKMSDSYKKRFINEHKNYINKNFDHYYGIEKEMSFTNAKQFERFCSHIKAKYSKVTANKNINLSKFEALYLVEEFSFDPILIAEFYKKKIKNAANINVLLNTKAASSEKETNHWRVVLEDNKNNKQVIKALNVVNATYSSINQINQIFQLPTFNLVHEISEIALVVAPKIKNIGLTVMDGPFASIMPYGLSDLHSLSSVSYTHHEATTNKTPSFECAKCDRTNRDWSRECNKCNEPIQTNFFKMKNQISKYFKEDIEINHFFSMFTVKTKLKSSYIDDSRPTEISRMASSPNFYSLFSGKINSIYEVEKILK